MKPIRDEDLTPDERANGWDGESLTKYRDSRDRAAAGRVFPQQPKLVVQSSKNWDPFRWKLKEGNQNDYRR